MAPLLVSTMKIDPHVHFRDETQAYKETIAHGLALAKTQGVNIVFDMPNTATPLLNAEDVRRRLSRVPSAEKKNYYLYVGATSNPDQLAEAVKLVNTHSHVVGIKLFAGKSTGNLAVINPAEQQRIYRVLSENDYRGVLAVHCEKESEMTNTFDPQQPVSHALARPNRAEIVSIKDQIIFAKDAGFQGNLHICHVSTKESIALVHQARQSLNITCGVTPHHLLWDASKLEEPNGLLYKMNPPLRSKEDVAALRTALKQEMIDWIETDHAPHSVGEKLHAGFPSGYPSLYLYKDLVETFLPKLGLSQEQLWKLTFQNIQKTFQLNV